MLTVTNLTHTYRDSARSVLAIDDWTASSGAQILLRGVSGSGKTTLFNIAAGLLRPTTGQVRIDTIALYTLSEAARDRVRAACIGYVFQSHHLLPAFTILENVIMPMQFAGVIAPTQRAGRARDLLDRVGLADLAERRPRQLSTGQRLRAAVARALANRPSLVLADEPTAALDADNAALVMDFLGSTCADIGATLIVASHDPALADRFDEWVDLRAGHLISVMPEAVNVVAGL